jgi:hypothetical protein
MKLSYFLFIAGFFALKPCLLASDDEDSSAEENENPTWFYGDNGEHIYLNPNGTVRRVTHEDNDAFFLSFNRLTPEQAQEMFGLTDTK